MITYHSLSVKKHEYAQTEYPNSPSIEKNPITVKDIKNDITCKIVKYFSTLLKCSPYAVSAGFGLLGYNLKKHLLNASIIQIYYD